MHKFHQFAINVKYLLICMILPGIFITTSPKGPEQIILPSLKESSIGRQGYASLRTYTYSLPSQEKGKILLHSLKEIFILRSFGKKLSSPTYPYESYPSILWSKSFYTESLYAKNFVHESFLRCFQPNVLMPSLSAYEAVTSTGSRVR